MLHLRRNWLHISNINIGNTFSGIISFRNTFSGCYLLSKYFQWFYLTWQYFVVYLTWYHVVFLLQADARCELCKFMVELLDESLQKNATMQSINAILMQICNALPATTKPTVGVTSCSHFVSPIIFQISG